MYLNLKGSGCVIPAFVLWAFGVYGLVAAVAHWMR